MKQIFKDDIVTAIDIGTTKICVIIAKKTNDQIDIIAIGKAPSYGLKKGVVVDIHKTIESINAAKKEAELVADMQIERATVGISGSHIQAMNSIGAVPIKKNNRVSRLDIAAAIDAAKAVPIPEGQQILHVLPQYFKIDNQDKISDPLGMHGVRLETQVHIITGSIASAQNIVQCCKACNVIADDIVLEQLASAEAVLSTDERELGVAVLDIGGGTSDFAIFQNNSIRHTAVIPIAGNHFTNDIAVGIQTTIKDAERIKKELSKTKDLFDAKVEIERACGNEMQTVDLKNVSTIVELRAIELLNIIKDEIEKYGLRHMMPTGLVITGGGSLLKDMIKISSEVLNMPVRLGAPKISSSLPESLSNPIYATGYGLLLNAFKKQRSGLNESSSPLVIRVFDRMKHWVSDFF